ncbi:hypothetical protein ACFVW8_20135 [Streptomyces sp. NPDC058221]|uniref:hypothetical protein n=1 Tax=Streptomyces sp. NPDC058221 TaxID=3346388 RepID=UPI0036E5E141
MTPHRLGLLSALLAMVKCRGLNDRIVFDKLIQVRRVGCSCRRRGPGPAPVRNNRLSPLHVACSR